MAPNDHPEIAALFDALDACERDAVELVSGLTEEQGRGRAAPGTWSVAECLDHLATANRVYIAAMTAPAERARRAGRTRRRAALPGVIGGWFVRQLEPPVKSRMRAPSKIVPRPSPGLRESFDAFLAEQHSVREFIRDYADIDLAGVRFVNPFVRAIRFSLATGLHVIPAHERRHLLQAWGVRRAVAG